MPTIHTRIDAKRGCGYRKEGGMYMVSGGMAVPCGKLPLPLTVCPCCSAGIKPTRGFTWIHSSLFGKTECKPKLTTAFTQDQLPTTGKLPNCLQCPMNWENQRMGLLWIGEKYYATPRDFTREAALQGISRRIAQVPRDFVIGETWIALAHRKAIQDVDTETGEVSYTAGVFSAFCPTTIEYVVKGTETEEELQILDARGFTLVHVVRDVDAQQALSI